MKAFQLNGFTAKLVPVQCSMDRQDGQNVICRNCSTAIYIPSIGQAGGCNPVGLASRVEGDSIVVELKELRHAETKVPGQ